MNTYKLSDSVIARIAQVLQECILLGVDVVDLLRQIEVMPNENGSLDLTPEYATQVEGMHKKLLSDLEELNNKQSKPVVFTQ